jgi:S-formylglutathione hydrolase FrmB
MKAFAPRAGERIPAMKMNARRGMVIALLALGIAGCGKTEKKKSCEDLWAGINRCIEDHRPSPASGDCVFILPEYYPGEMSCEGAQDLASLGTWCAEGKGPDEEVLGSCYAGCRKAPMPASAQEHLELAASTAACMGLEGWPMEIRWVPEWVSMKPGESRTVKLRTQKSPPFPIAFDLSVPADDEGKVTVEPSVVVFTTGVNFMDVTVTAHEATGTAVTALYDDNTQQTFRADLPVLVSSEGYGCGGSSAGTVAAGGRLEVPEDGNEGLAGSFVAFPPDETLPDAAAAIACAADIVTGPYVPIGPAVEFSPGTYRVRRELSFGIPLSTAMIHEEASWSNVAVFYTGPSVSARKVLVANAWIDVQGPAPILRFMSPRFGTYQAAIDPMAGKRSFTRHFTFRGITGVSMGGCGAGLVGLRNHEKFDFVGPLGGPANWTGMLDYMNRYHMGGFCTAQDTTGSIGEHCPVPEPRAMFEFSQDYENWFYPDGWDGQGGTFNREDYLKIFRDLTRAFGNAALYSETSTYIPPGLDEDWFKLSPVEKCAAAGVQRLEGFYDRRYNPEGTYPVITFCDGGESRDDIGKWDPDAAQTVPLDITFAVDVNDNGRRDPGEPVIAQPHEPYEDVGLDGLASTGESGYDPVANPDPAGDDFDYQFNPGGLEGNGLYDEGEPYSDDGLDGVPGTPQQAAGGYDWGEGNGRFDYNPNVLSFFDNDAYHQILGMTDDELKRVDVMLDAGIRDLFDFAPGINGLAGALHGRGLEVSMWRNFAGLYGGDDEYTYDSTRVDYENVIGKNFVILYGDPDAAEEVLERGDGGHVGTPAQVLNRLMTVTMAMSARWPEGDRRDALQDISEEYLMTFEFHAEDRDSQVSIFLPPGYHNEENYDEYYPVIYFLHGYGQEPNDLILSAIIFGNNMISPQILTPERMQKVIMVFPDGRCRFSEDDPEWEHECLKGGFYADAVYDVDGVRGPRMETILLDLIDYIDATYRTKAAEDQVVYY